MKMTEVTGEKRGYTPVDSYAKLFSPCDAEQSGTGGTQCGMPERCDEANQVNRRLDIAKGRKVGGHLQRAGHC